MRYYRAIHTGQRGARADRQRRARSKRLGTDGTFVEFVEKHAQTEKLKHTHDPNRHDWQVLVKSVESVVSKEQNEGENEAGEIEETAKDNKKATIKFEETISRHVSWQKKNKKRHEWKAWHETLLAKRRKVRGRFQEKQRCGN